MTLHTGIAAYSGQPRFNITFVSTSWRHLWDPTLGITLRKMSAMANTTLIVTTVTKPATNPGREKTPRDADATPRVNIQDFCEEYYDDILPIIMDKIRHDKRKEVYARLDFGEGPSERRIREGRAHSTDLAKLTRQAQPSADRIEEASGIVLAEKAALSGGTLLMEIVLRVETALAASGNHMITLTPPTGHDQPWISLSRQRPLPPCEEMCEEVDPFTPRIRNFKSSLKKRMPNNVKTYDGTRDPEDHVKFFQAATQVKRWAMPTWCHMFNSTLLGAARVLFDELPPESIYSYKDLKAAFLAYFMQQKKYVKDLVKIHNIKQKDGETIEDFMERFKVETGLMKGAPECMRISRFMHGVNNLELTKLLNENVLKIMEEMMITTTAFIRGEAAAAGKKKGNTSWRTHDQSKRHILEKRSDFRGQPREGRGSSRFTHLTRTPKEILAAEAEKFRPPPPMVTTVEKRSSNESYDFHNDKRHSTDECMQLKKQIEELVRAGKLSHLIKEIKQGRDQSKKVTQSFKRIREITFPSLATSSETEGPLVIEAKIGGHMIHRMYVDRGDADHSTRAWMNFMIVRSLSPYNGIIRRLRIKEIQAVPSTAHEMLKFPADGEIVTIRNTILIPAECATMITSSKEIPKEARDCYPLSKIDWKVEFLCDNPFKCFLDAYKGYHQIQLAESDEEKTAFHTGQWVYCYTKMPFGLKNAGATY
nr:hypothetical protein [Tanacetum cinerariifolium]